MNAKTGDAVMLEEKTLKKLVNYPIWVQLCAKKVVEGET